MNPQHPSPPSKQSLPFNQPAFIPPIPLRRALHSPSSTSTCPRCSAHVPDPERRTVLKRLVSSATSLALFAFTGNAHAADAPKVAEEETPCSNCTGSGKVPCELCSGTGFWRALSGSDPRQRYKGVVCPECEGVGELTCPVCLGTGEGNVRGLLRRRKVEPGPGRVLQS